MRTRLLAALCLLAPAAALAAKDPRCAGKPAARAARFSDTALKGASAAERYAAYIQACALDDVVALTQTLVRFKTVSSEAPAAKNPEVAAMGRALESWAKQHGFGFRTVGDNDVFELSWGEGEPLLGLVFHGDVVPAAAHEWKRAPFKPVVEKGRLYGRGVEDDKGPIASGLVALAMAKDLGLKPQGKVLVIIGNGEESDWNGMKKYADTEPKPTHVISVDSGYPVMAAQSGFVAWTLEAPVGSALATPKEGTVARAVDVSAGEFLTQVPGTATLKLEPVKGQTPEAVLAAVKAAIAQEGPARKDLKAEAKREGSTVVLTAHGVAVHSSTADEGHNALWDLSAVASRLSLEDNGIAALLRVVAKRFDGDHHGDKLGLKYEDTLMGPLLVAPTVLRVKDGSVSLGVNMRRPQGKDAAAFNASLDAAAKRVGEDSGGQVKEGSGRYLGDPHVADTSGPLVKTLMDIYQRQRKAPDAVPGSIRGGTYARLFPRAVDFGPAFPNEPYTGHAPDESIALETLDLSTRMLAEAVHTLAIAPASEVKAAP
ncbi:Sapep family Mn(2+)-dependent dipeptidase [Corallococcus carmarthensis]|uniref:Sapep family Mn(2+)-dependent dipeptidase n=1 Tax=Corallococcus carmarthensis TaxID=2316728 RepID=UPI00148D3056|nr:Sapep family Mn(2+)-dependent dipeptidase [Corallococcus carmarthensis]NOK22400.1 Sapep family Mn(2+)-dependent dipeptidase [Corallococcus carmarthensis]